MQNLFFRNPAKDLNVDPLKMNWIELSELSVLLGIHKRTISRLRKSGVLRATALGGRLYFKRSEVVKALEHRFEVGSITNLYNHGTT